MASLRAIRTRIKSVRNTQKITKALKMVAAAKLRRAQDAVVRARPYAQLIDDMLASLARSGFDPEQPPHPLLLKRPVKRVEVVMLTSDRGLCGGFNANIVRRGQRFLIENDGKLEKIQFSTIGRRGRDFAKKRGFNTRKDYAGFVGKLHISQAGQVASDLIEAYEQDHLDAVFLLYNKFKSAMSQEITLAQLLPIEPGAVAAAAGDKGRAQLQPVEHLYEPSREEVLRSLLPKHLAMQIWRAMLESEASFQGAQMTAMDSATNNAAEMIGRLTLQYNRARQAAITKELMEIVSGAEALK